jgi:hypothetical protein
MFRVKSLTINNVTDVSPFWDLCINLGFLALFDQKLGVRWLPKNGIALEDGPAPAENG